MEKIINVETVEKSTFTRTNFEQGSIRHSTSRVAVVFPKIQRRSHGIPPMAPSFSLGRLAVELKRSWFNMDFLPWSLEWSQVIGIKSDKGSARCSLGRFRRAKRCPCNKMMFSSMLQYLRLGERISSLLTRVERGEQDASLRMELYLFSSMLLALFWV